MAKRSETPTTPSTALHESLTRLTERMARTKSLRAGTVIIYLNGEGGTYTIGTTASGTTVSKSSGAVRANDVILEITGDGEKIRGIIEGEKDAIKEYIDGGLRIRGDLRYFSDMAVELGILKKPL